MPQQAIYDAIPHREPFLLVDQILEQGRRGSSAPRSSRATRTSSPDIIRLAPGAGRAAVRGGHAVRRILWRRNSPRRRQTAPWSRA